MEKRLLLLLLLAAVLLGCTAPESSRGEIAPPLQTLPEESMAREVANASEPETAAPETPEGVPAEEPEMPEPRCSRPFSPTRSSGPHYRGPLFDAHFHLPNLIDPSEIPEGHGDGRDDHSSVTDPVLGRDAELDRVLCNFDNENVVGVIGFAIGAEQVLDKTLERSRDVREESAGKINVFLMPAGFSVEALERIQESDSGLFRGYGEIAFYHPSYAATPPDSPPMMAVYEIARKHDLIVMFHPDGQQKTKVENAVKNNPEVTFLIHGPEPEEYITYLMDKYPNVYYSLDTIMIRLPNVPGALMYMASGKAEFTSTFNRNFDLMLNDAVRKWKPRIEQHPDRFMWGTDRSHSWTYDEEVSAMLEEYARTFIGRLDPSVQEKFAYRNAEALLQH